MGFVLGKWKENGHMGKGIIPRWSRIYKGYPFALSCSMSLHLLSPWLSYDDTSLPQFGKHSLLNGRLRLQRRRKRIRKRATAMCLRKGCGVGSCGRKERPSGGSWRDASPDSRSALKWTNFLLSTDGSLTLFSFLFLKCRCVERPAPAAYFLSYLPAEQDNAFPRRIFVKTT